jgi:hypothetical protein
MSVLGTHLGTEEALSSKALQATSLPVPTVPKVFVSGGGA